MEMDTTTDDGGLEYHVKFPSTCFNYDRRLNVDRHRLPVVLLFGWAGCQDKYLAKYSQLYEQQGLITLRYIVPIRNLFWQRSAVRHIARKLLKLLYDFNFNTHPILVHCFSNGGAFLYQNLSKALESQANGELQIKGVIFDSGPGRRRLRGLYLAVSAIMGGNVVYNATVSAFITLVCFLLWMCEWLQTCMWSSPDVIVIDPFEMLLDEQFRWPQHFVYSEADALVPHKDIEYFIRHRRELGVDVTARKFANSPHVKHYFADKEAYEASVYSFVQRCLRQNGDDGGGEVNVVQCDDQ